jgi:hypothetical protein
MTSQNLRHVRGKRPSARPKIHATTDERLDQWFIDFDARMADLTTQQDALLRSLGVEPVRHKSAVPPETIGSDGAARYRHFLAARAHPRERTTAMQTMNISLHDPMKQFVDTQVSAGR